MEDIFQITKQRGRFVVDHVTARGTTSRLATFEDGPLQRVMMLEAGVIGMETKMVEDIAIECLGVSDIANLKLAARSPKTVALMQQAFEVVFPEEV